MEGLQIGNQRWLYFREWENITKIPDEEEVFLETFEGKMVLEAKMNESESWKENKLYDEGQG